MRTILFISIIALAGCVTLKQRERICATCTLNQSTKDSIVTVVKHDTISLSIHDTIPYALPNPCANLCDSFSKLKQFSEVIKSDRGTRLKLYTKNNKLHIDDHLDSLKTTAIISNTITTESKTIEREKAAQCQLPHLTKWDSFFIRSGQIAWVILILFIVYKLIRYYFKLWL